MKVIDASVAAKWLLDEEYSDRALSLLDAAIDSEERLIAPALLHAEVTNIIRRAMIEESVDLVTARHLLARMLQMPVAVTSRQDLYDAALVLASTFSLKAAYDALYLALAHAERCEFWTDDRRLLAAVGPSLPWVHWIADFPS